MRDAAKAYQDTCPGADFTVDTQGSAEGVRPCTELRNPLLCRPSWQEPFSASSDSLV
ncbi:MAG: hypothetical protein ACRDRU_07630 [Pseudonocardiaceae bacterium]